MGNFAENLNLGNRFRPPMKSMFQWISNVWKLSIDTYAVHVTVLR